MVLSLADLENYHLTFCKSDSSNQVSIATSEQSFPMNAHFIQCPYLRGLIIAASEPGTNEEELFWKMVLQQQIKLVVSLSDMVNIPFSTQQLAQEAVFYYGNSTVTVNSYEKTNFGSVYKLMLASPTAMETTFINFRLFNEQHQFDRIGFQNILAEVVTKLKGDFPVLFCSRDGGNETGIFLALANSAEQAKSENKVDIFRTVKDLRDYRLWILNDLESYKICYQAINEYLNGQAYANVETIYQNA